VDSFGDHRIAMAFAIAAGAATGPVVITDVDAVETSFPGFEELMALLGANISVESAT
jgi:3-phosphoshikimate 1-carboxyvinyltransferase